MGQSQAAPRKIILFHSSIGNGHIRAAQAIQQEILQLAPTTRTMLQDIRAFMNPAWRRIDERLYWFLVKHLPESFETLFHSMQARGCRVPSLSMLPNDYPEKKVAAFLALQAPDAIFATHYGAAQVLGNLREQGLLSGVRIGWLHTDFFEGYFPRISRRIDRTFLAHADLESRWLAAGVPRDKVVTSGMPVPAPTEASATARGLASLGLAPDRPTLLLVGGREGLGDFVTVVSSVTRHCRAPVQIVAVCGTNARQQARLAALGARLPSHVALISLGLLPHAAMMAFMQDADLLLTKAGGMTPCEAFCLGTPTILLDVVGGHERENAAMFARLGLARIAADTAEVGKMVADILADPHKRAAMQDAQRAFREQIRTSRIVRFLLDDAFSPRCLPADFGTENGTPVANIQEALACIDGQAPADLELLLSYSTSRSRRRIVAENPFGHLGLRIGETVFSANHVADRKNDPNFLQHLCLGDYLYGVRRPSSSQSHIHTYGMAYGRETIGLRVAGVPAQRMSAMLAQAQRMEEQFRRGALLWDRRKFNCADVVARILHAGGYGDDGLHKRFALPAMPLDVFEKARCVFGATPGLNMDLVAYRQVPGTQVCRHFSRFPLSLSQPLRSAARIIRHRSMDALEASVTMQVAAGFGDARLFVDDLRAPGLSVERNTAKPWRRDRARRRLEAALAADLGRLLGRFGRLVCRSGGKSAANHRAFAFLSARAPEQADGAGGIHA